MFLQIIPPPEWKPHRINYENIKDLLIPEPIYQIVLGGNGVYQLATANHTSIDVKGFEELCMSNQYKTPEYDDIDDLERQYWDNVTQSVPIYGADVERSLFGDESVWNLNDLGCILDYIPKDYGVSIGGINTSYTYFGMFKSTFAWHTEDMDLYAINYLHWGAPKTWYTIPPSDAKNFEELASKLFPSSYRVCSSFLRHKTTLLSPDVLKKHGISFNRVNNYRIF